VITTALEQSWRTISLKLVIKDGAFAAICLPDQESRSEWAARLG
jgi:hypothetical protein